MKPQKPIKKDSGATDARLRRVKRVPLLLKALGILLLLGSLAPGFSAFQCYSEVTSANREITQTRKEYGKWKESGKHMSPVSYTHLTLPTIYSV